MNSVTNSHPAPLRTPRFQLISGRSDTVRWRLLGSNNASLGLGAVEYQDSRECVAAIAWLRVNLGRTRVELTHHKGVHWRWALYARTDLIATASHAYGRRIEAKRGYERFVAAIEDARELVIDGRVVDWRTKYGIDP